MKYKCPKCGSVFEGPVKFCPSCGQELKITAPVEEKKEEPKKKYKCPKCGTIFEGKIKFCPGCGSEIKFKEEKKPEPEDEIITGSEKKKTKKYKCPNCGALHDKPVKFCSECGSELTFGEETPKEEPEIEEAKVEQPKVEEPKVEEPKVVEEVPVEEEPEVRKAEVIEEPLPEDDGSSFVEPAVSHTAAPVVKPALSSEKEEILPNEDHKVRGTGFGVWSLILSIPSFLVYLVSFVYAVIIILEDVVPGFTVPTFLVEFMAFIAPLIVIGQWIVLGCGLLTTILALVFAGIVKKLQGKTGLAKAAGAFAGLNLAFYIINTLAIIAMVLIPIILLAASAA